MEEREENRKQGLFLPSLAAASSSPREIDIEEDSRG